MLARFYILLAVGTYYAIVVSGVESTLAQVSDCSNSIPNYLNPNPNSLSFPIKPEEVKVQETQPISLEQALELARRNNPKLQVALLQLQRSHAALREAKTSIYPAINLNIDLSRVKFSSSELFAEQLREQFQLLPAEDFRFFQREPATIFSSRVQLIYGLYNFCVFLFRDDIRTLVVSVR